MSLKIIDLYAQKKYKKERRENILKTLDEIASEFGEKIGKKMKVWTAFSGSLNHPYMITTKPGLLFGLSKTYATADQGFLISLSNELNFYVKDPIILEIAEKHLSNFAKKYGEANINLYKCFTEDKK